VSPGDGLAENTMSSDRKSGEGSGDTSDEFDMLDKLLVGPAGRLDTEEKYTEDLNDRPRFAIIPSICCWVNIPGSNHTSSQLIARSEYRKREEILSSMALY
jgi:hypothetical protein